MIQRSPLGSLVCHSKNLFMLRFHTTSCPDLLVLLYPPFIFLLPFRGFAGDSVVKNLPAMQGTWSPRSEDPLEEEMATHSSILTWRIPRTEEPGGLQSMGPQRAWLSTRAHTHTHTSLLSLFLPSFQQIFSEHALGIYIWITDYPCRQ